MDGVEVHVVRLLGGTSDILCSEGSKWPNDDEETPPVVCDECLRFKASKSNYSASLLEVSLLETTSRSADVSSHLPLIVLLEKRMSMSSYAEKGLPLIQAYGLFICI